MNKFSFTTENRHAAPTTFNGPRFYNVYKESEFLRSSANVELILSKAYQLRQKLKDTAPGDSVKIEGMCLERNAPLLVKKGGPGVTVEDYEFTLNRLTGVAAVYAYENRLRFPVMDSSEAKALGLTWDNENAGKCKLYLSAITGTEHFVDQFGYWPLVCGLRKYQLKKMPLELIVKMAKIKNDRGERMAAVLKKNYVTAKRLWTYFPNSSQTDLKSLLAVAPPELKKLFAED